MTFKFRRFGQISVFWEVVYIALLPVALFFAFRVSPNNNFGIDPWVYVGYIHNFRDLIDRYGLTYYSVRFGLIAPHAFLASVFGPIPGYLAFCYLMYLLAGTPLYLLFRKRYSVEAAAFAYLMFTSSVWVARSILWTYTDSAAVPYMVAATALIFLDSAHRRSTNIAIGALIALAVNSNFFSIAIGGLSSVGYVVLHRGNLMKRLRADVPWIACGFLAVFACGAIGYAVCCGEPNFLAPTIYMIKWGFSGAAEKYKHENVVLFARVYYVYLPVLLMLALILTGRLVSKEHQRLYWAATCYVLVAVAFAAWWQFLSYGLMLELFYYFCFLIGSFIVGLILIPVTLSMAAVPSGQRKILIFAAAGLLVVPTVHVLGIANLVRITLDVVIVADILTLALIALAFRYSRILPYAAACFASAIQLQMSAASQEKFGNGPTPEGVYFHILGRSTTESLAYYRLSLRLIAEMPRYRDDGRQLLFWYADGDDLSNQLQSIYLWGYSRLNAVERAGMPEMTPEDWKTLSNYTSPWLVLLGSEADMVEKGVDVLRRGGLRFTEQKAAHFCEATSCLYLRILDVRNAVVDAPLGSRAAELFTIEPRVLWKAFDQHGYGRARYWWNTTVERYPRIGARWEILEGTPGGGWRFRPSTRADHLATPFRDIAPAFERDIRFRLTVQNGAHERPTTTCHIYVQDEGSNNLLDVPCRNIGDEHQSIVVFTVRNLPKRVRLVVQAGDGKPTLLPSGLRLEQLLFDASSSK